MSIEEGRAEIDRVDDELVAILNRRARLTIALAELKSGVGLSLYDPDRECEVVERACRACSPPLDETAVRAIFTCVLRESRRMAAPLFKENGVEPESAALQTEPAVQSL
jgi:chorismate mutase / prephenate dehydratase